MQSHGTVLSKPSDSSQMSLPNLLRSKELAFMPIFISYNHRDKDFAKSLARNLVYARHNVWIDTWELNAGDSLLDKIQKAIGESDAILAIFSEHSIDSAWCKREINAGLMRELEERRAILIPCIVGDCEIPLFLSPSLTRHFKDCSLSVFYGDEIPRRALHSGFFGRIWVQTIIFRTPPGAGSSASAR